jgi:hypothetical protein
MKRQQIPATRPLDRRPCAPLRRQAAAGPPSACPKGVLLSLFKTIQPAYGKTPEPETPYQKAAQVWDERIGSARVQARNWRLMAFGCLILAAGFRAALVWQSARGTVVPYVVEVDNLGAAQRRRPGAADYRPTDPQIAWHLARFIEGVRGLPADPVVLRQNWLRAYDFATDRGARRSTTMPAPTIPSPASATRRSRSRSRASSAPRPTASASPGSSGTTRTASSPAPSAGPPS